MSDASTFKEEEEEELRAEVDRLRAESAENAAQMRLMESKVRELEESLELKTLELNEARNKLQAHEAPSILLTYLPKLKVAGVADLILEFIVAGQGGPHSILSLRKVHPETREWIDSLSPSQTKKIFFGIPIKLILNRDDLKKFHACPPPPSATSMILEMPRGNRNGVPAAMSKGLEGTLLKAKKTTPAFFYFWTNRLQSLHTNFVFTSEFLDVMGLPNSLRNLDCFEIYERHCTSMAPILFQVQSLRIHRVCLFRQDLGKELDFYKQLASNTKLKRLRITLSFPYLLKETWIKLTRDRNLLKGIQLLIDSRKDDKDFKLVLDWEEQILDGKVGDQNLQNFVSSVVHSSSSIRLVSLHRTEIEKIQEMCGNAATQIFKTIVGISYFWKTSTAAVENVLEENTFPSLKSASLMIFKDDNRVVLPDSLQCLRIISRVVFPPTAVTLPETLKVLNLDLRMLGIEHEVWRPAELKKILTSVSQHCTLLNELCIQAIRILIREDDLKEWKATPSQDDVSQYDFHNLKSFDVSLEIWLEKKLKGEGANVITRNILLRTFKVQYMSCLKFNLHRNKYHYATKLVVDSECIDALLTSPLAESLVSTNLEKYITQDARESGDEFLAVIRENRLQREEKLGRQGRRQNFFNLSELEY